MAESRASPHRPMAVMAAAAAITGAYRAANPRHPPARDARAAGDVAEPAVAGAGADAAAGPGEPAGSVAGVGADAAAGLGEPAGSVAGGCAGCPVGVELTACPAGPAAISETTPATSPAR